MIIIQPLNIEVIDNKKIILHDIVDYDSNIANDIISEDEKLKIVKLNEKFNNIIRERKLEVSIGN